jgi:hypothetical protein
MKKYLAFLLIAAAACGNSVTQSGGSPFLTATPDTVAFGTVAIGVVSAPETVTVKNVGTFPASNFSLLAGGSGANNYNIVFSDCGGGATLLPDASCIFVLEFVPRSPPGAKPAFFDVLAQPSGGVAINLTGTAIAPP